MTSILFVICCAFSIQAQNFSISNQLTDPLNDPFTVYYEALECFPDSCYLIERLWVHSGPGCVPPVIVAADEVEVNNVSILAGNTVSVWLPLAGDYAFFSLSADGKLLSIY